MVPSPTYAPTFTYIGGIHVTPAATWLPSRMLEPPGTMRAPRTARHIHQSAKTKSHEDPFFYPGVHSPSCRLRLVRLGCPDLSAVQQGLEIFKKSKILVGVGSRLLKDGFNEPLDVCHWLRPTAARCSRWFDSSTLSIRCWLAGFG